MAVPFENPTNTTILEIIGEAAEGIRQPAPSTLNSTSRDARNWIKAANAAGQEIRDKYIWPFLSKDFLITTSATVKSYSMPEDFNRSIFDTFWQKGQFRQMLGPITPREFVAQQNGVATVFPYFQFRFSGVGTNNIEVLQDPGTGQQIVFRYQSRNWLLPTDDWHSGASCVNSQCVQNAGNVYACQNTWGPSTVAPTQTSGVSKGSDSVIWQFAAYEKVVEDGARPLVNSTLLKLGIQYNWLMVNGFDYDAILTKYERLMSQCVKAATGARAFIIADEGANKFFGWANVPQTGWGQ